MDTNNYRKYFYYALSVLLLIIGLFGIKRLITKPDLPFIYSFTDNKITASEYYDGINPDDIVVSVDNIQIKSTYQLETILDGKTIGEDADLGISTINNSVFSLQVHLGRYYENLYFIIVSFLVGFSFSLVSVFLIQKKSDERIIKILIWVLLLFSLATMTSPGKYYSATDWIAYFVRASHVSSYFLGAIAFLHFTFTFSKTAIKKNNILTVILYIAAFIFCIILITVQILSVLDSKSDWVFKMEKLWVLTESILLICIISGALHLFLYYRKLSNLNERRKTEWIFWGLAAGVFPFLLLWLLPRILGFNEIIKEEFLLSFMIFVPVFFAMAVVKYQVFEIEVFVKKSILYSSLTFITVVIYFLAITIIAFFANDLMKEYSNLVSISMILFIAFIFNPLQNKIRNIINKTFYRETFNFEKAVSAFSEGVKDQNTINGLSKYVINEIEKIIPVKRIALIAGSEGEGNYSILSENNFRDLKNLMSTTGFRRILKNTKMILSQPGKEKTGIIEDESIYEVLKSEGVKLIIPFVPEPKDIIGALIMGDKLSELNYSKRDIDILNVLISNISLAFKKLQLQRKLVIEEIEISRLEEINEKMSYYVSSVSHDLKTPLTSIKMFTEILKGKEKFIKNDSTEYLDIIEGETDRLARLINNVLNFTKIENGIKEYSFIKFNLSDCIKEVIKIMEYQFVMEKFEIEKSIQENIFITADDDAVKEVLINLFSNSIKYSLDKKFIKVSSYTENEFAVIKIEDKGIGISQEDIQDIFKPYVRLKNSDSKHTGGAGIGLSIVKNIMDAHKGRIKVESTIGNGSTFILYFPVAVVNKFIG